MATIVTIASGDLITNSRADLNTNFANLNSDKIETSTLDTDTSLAANSDSKIATQKAVKAYVDAGGNVNASTTSRGIVEEATQAELTAGTQSGGSTARLFLNPVHTVQTSSGAADEGKIPRLNSSGQLATGFLSGGNMKIISASRAQDAVSAAVNYAHGLGRVPRGVRIYANAAFNGGGTASQSMSKGGYDGTSNMCVYERTSVSGSSGTVATNASAAIVMIDQNGGTQTGVITVDVTNVTITWTKAGSAETESSNIIMEVF